MPTLPLGASLRVFWHALGCALVPAICVCTASVGGHCADGRARSAAALSSGSLCGNQQQRPSDGELVSSLDGVRAVACPLRQQSIVLPTVPYLSCVSSANQADRHRPLRR